MYRRLKKGGAYNTVEYVYKYLNNRGDTVYVGITNDMHRRVKEHKSDKLSAIKNPLIFYFPVKYRGDAEMLETYLIGWYGTKKYYNVAKTRKGDFSFLDVVEDFPWQHYEEGMITDEKPFAISDVIGTKEVVVEKEVIVEKKIYIDQDTDGYAIDKFHRDCCSFKDFLDEQIATGKQMIEELKSKAGSRNADVLRLRVMHDWFLVDKRLRALSIQRKYVDYVLFPKCFLLCDDREYELRKKKYVKAKSISDSMLDKLHRTGRIGKVAFREKRSSYLGESNTDSGRSLCI